MITGYGLVEGNPVYMFCQDLTVNGGAVSANHARKITKVIDIAIKTGAPVVGIYDTAGAALDDGIDALNAYSVIAGKLAAASGVVPTIALVLGQCGGMASSIAGMADFTIMSKNGSLFVNGPLVVSAAAGKNIDMEEGSFMVAAYKGRNHEIMVDSQLYELADEIYEDYLPKKKVSGRTAG